MQEKKYNLLKALSWYTVGNILIKSINFFTLRLFTDLLNTSDYGVFGIYQSYLSIFEMIILFGTAHTIKMVKYDEEIDYDKYVSSIIFIPIIGTIILLLASLMAFRFTSSFAGLSEEVWDAIFITAGVAAVANVVVGKLILDGKYKIYIVYSLINTVFNIGLSLALCYTIFKENDTYWARILGCMVANIVSCLFVILLTKVSSPRIRYIRKGIIFGLPLLVHSIATQVLVQSDKILISQLDSYSAVGIYTAATNIVVIPNTLLSSIEHSWSPWFYQEMASEHFDVIRKRNTQIIGLYGIGCSLFILACPEIVKIMTNKEYWDSMFVLIPLAFVSFAELIYLVPLNLELFYKKNNAIWIYTTIVVVVNIVFDYMFINLFGYLAGAWVTCVTRFLLFVLHYIRAKKIKNENTIDLKVLIITVIAMLAVCLLTVEFSEKWLLRWSVIIALGAAIIVTFTKYHFKKRKVQ